MKKILICSTLLTTIRAFLIPHINLLKELGFIVDICGNKDTRDLDTLVHNVYDLSFQRNPFSIRNFSAAYKLSSIVYENSYDIIHFHTPIASAFGRLAVRKFRKNGTKIIYTAHGFHFFKGAPIINWLIYYPVERWLAKYTDLLITINKEDYSRACTFNAKRVEYVPGVGLDINRFTEVTVDKQRKRRELGISVGAFLVLSVGELNKNKNHEVIFRAIAKLNNSSIFYLICGQGPQEKYLENLSQKLGLEKQIKFLGFRRDIAEICKVADIFAFPSKREGLGLAALEAMASGLPIVTSNVHGIKDYSINGRTGYNCCADDVNGYARSIEMLINNTKDRMRMGQNNMEAVKVFDLQNIISCVQDLYSEMSGRK